MSRTHPFSSANHPISAWLLGALAVAPFLAAPGAAAPPAPRLDTLSMPPGFEISLWAEGVQGARSLTRSDTGVVFVGSRQRREKGVVHAIVDRGGERQVIEIAAGLNMPNGVAWRDGALYVAEVHRILRFDDIDNQLDSPPEPAVVLEGLPEEAHHGWKYLAFGPKGRLWFQVGAPCNICAVEDPYASILALDLETGTYEVFARGVRNTVGMDWHPETGELWFTDNGRDMLGEDTPPDELNRAPTKGLHFGYPFCHGKAIEDPELGSTGSCTDSQPPAQNLAPHTAAIGMKFYRGTMLPAAYRGAVLIAEHGSWNRKVPIGYRITAVTLGDDGSPTSYEPLVAGWLAESEGGKRKFWGRPADLLELPDGSLLISDDYQNAIYRLTYAPTASEGAGSALGGR